MNSENDQGGKGTNNISILHRGWSQSFGCVHFAPENEPNYFNQPGKKAVFGPYVGNISIFAESVNIFRSSQDGIPSGDNRTVVRLEGNFFSILIVK
jgi:hypothetical protein